MIALSLLSTVAAGQVRQMLVGRFDQLTALLLAGGLHVLLVVLLQAVLPPIGEVPGDFPASLLWQFRIASLGSQLVLWVAPELRWLRRTSGVSSSA